MIDDSLWGAIPRIGQHGANQNWNRAMSVPCLGAEKVTAPVVGFVMIAPKPPDVLPFADRVGVENALLKIGLFGSVRLNILVNSARICKLNLSRRRMVRPRLRFSAGRR